MPDLQFDFRPHFARTILEVLREWDTIDFDPSYQRQGGIWKEPKQQLFIDSIINGMDLPKLYFHERITTTGRTGETFYGVIDGKQRLQAIRKFVDDLLPLAADFEFLHGEGNEAGGRRYSELLRKFPELRSRFDGATLPIIVMRTDDEVLIEGLFTRLNEAVSLNAPEKRNALGGPIPTVIREVVKHEFFDMLPFDDLRYSHRDLAAKFLLIVKERRFVSTKKQELDDLVKLYRADANQAPGPDELRRRTEEVLTSMASFFRSRDTLLENVGWVVLFFYLFMFQRGTLPAAYRPDFESFVDTLVANRRHVRALSEGRVVPAAWKPDPSLSQFDALRQSVNDAGAFRTRYTILRQWFSATLKRQLPDPWPE